MTLNSDKVLFTSVKTRPNFDALYHGKGFQPPLSRHARDHVPLSSKPNTVCSHQCRRNRSLCIQPRFFEDRSKCAYGLKSSPYVEMLQCAFYPVRYPLNIGYHGKASRVRMVASWTRPWLGSIFNEFGGISIDV